MRLFAAGGSPMGALSVAGVEPLAGVATTGATGGGTCTALSGCGSRGINQASTIRTAIASKTLRNSHRLRIFDAATSLLESYCLGRYTSDATVPALSLAITGRMVCS